MDIKAQRTFIYIAVVCLWPLSWVEAQPYAVGTRSITFVDPSRNNRSIGCDVYYPATQSGNNAPLAQGVFSYVVFGHGFLMATSAYQPIAQAMASSGLIVFLPTTEGGFSPSHTSFARDLAFVGNEAYQQSISNSNFFFYEAMTDRYAVGGHSMGGGCTYLSVQYQNNLQATCLFTFAAAETNPSAINQMGAILLPNLMLAGTLDCVTPPANHQIPMYNAQHQDACRYLVQIIGGYHCQFNANNFTCSLGENSCMPPGGISRETQLQITNSITLPWLIGWLEPNCTALAEFGDIIEAGQGITVEQSCDLPELEQPEIAYEGPLTRCEGDWITLEAVPGIGSILWSTGETTQEILVLQSGAYSYTISNGQCALASDEVIVNYVPSVQATILADIPSILCNGDTMVLEADPPWGDITWSNGESAPLIYVISSGLYWFVHQDGPCISVSDTVELIFPEPVFPQIFPSGNMVLCPGDSLLITATPQMGSILWSNGWQNFDQWIDEAGNYFFDLTIDGCTYTSDILTVISEESVVLKVEVEGPAAICDGSPITLRSNLAQGNVVWNTGFSGLEISVVQPGEYYYILEGVNCIYFSDTVQIGQVSNPPRILEGARDTLCAGDSLILRAAVLGGSVIWSDGNQGLENRVNQGGEFYFILDSLGCVFYSDTVVIQEIVRPKLLIFPADSSSVCEGSSLELIQPDSILVEWNNGQFSTQIQVSEAGVYYYIFDTLGCRFQSDSAVIHVLDKPIYQIEVVADGPLCALIDSARVSIDLSFGAVLWFDADTASQKVFTEGGQYSFELLYEDCVFTGETLTFQFDGTWILDSLEILGKDSVIPGFSYIYSVVVTDPHVLFAWGASGDGVEFISRMDSASVQISIQENISDTVFLFCQLRDTVCMTDTVLQKMLLKTGSSSTVSEHFGLDLRVGYDADEWIIYTEAWENITEVRLYNMQGWPLSFIKPFSPIIRLWHRGLMPGIYIADFILSDGRRVHPIKLIKW